MLSLFTAWWGTVGDLDERKEGHARPRNTVRTVLLL